MSPELPFSGSGTRARSRLLHAVRAGVAAACVLPAIVLSGCSRDETPADPTAPVQAPRKPGDLRQFLDPAFTADIKGALVAEVPDLLDELAPAGKASLVVADITDANRPLVAEFDGEEMNYAASLPKVAILYAAFVEIDRGALSLDDELKDTLTRMIRNSSNGSATEVYERIGPERIAEILQAEPYRLYDQENGGGLWVGRGYGGELWQRDPVAGISHGASAMQVARFYHLLVTGQLVSESSTAAMLEILSRPAIRHKFVIGLAESNADAHLYRKSGTWRQYHADSALVVDPRYRYIVVAIIEDENDADILERLVGVADRAVADNHLP